MHAADKIEGTALLVTGVESEGHLRLSIFKDKCSKRLDVYFKPDALEDINFYLGSMPGRDFDGVKVAILDAELLDVSKPASNRAGDPILIDRVYGLQPLAEQDKIKEAEIR
ncbi:hypothetical protein F7D01_01230 [Erythrobacter sp. 3-20A1M]|uniref:hypothetical protein n=1 Tax=Erythrobacter sp. 3-20A1M TaxID=2653850 RepID=UPI001BFCC438|nr:hypothetical protein [Erythrobacter sp. 3-20A1M]QWC55894.1 hypothetical protein F7D01_01230 [Erythrobacter sp. 3-20A1M]